jgi:hypothetical protein
MDGPRSREYGARSGHNVRTRCFRGCTERRRRFLSQFPLSASFDSIADQQLSVSPCHRTQSFSGSEGRPRRRAVPPRRIKDRTANKARQAALPHLIALLYKSHSKTIKPSPQAPTRLPQRHQAPSPSPRAAMALTKSQAYKEAADAPSRSAPTPVISPISGHGARSLGSHPCRRMEQHSRSVAGQVKCCRGCF